MMQIPPTQKPVFYAIVGLTLIAGIIIGSLFAGYVLFVYKEKICVFSKAPAINTNLTQDQIQKAVSLVPNKTIFGKVLSKESGQFTIETTVTNLADPKNSTTTTVNIPFNQQKDKVIILESSSANSSNTIKPVGGSFADIKAGQQIYMKVFQDRKEVYILPTQ